MMDTMMIKQMSREEKLQTMEVLWHELSENDSDVESPSWHQEALNDTEARISAGSEKVIEWETAKRDIRKKCE